MDCDQDKCKYCKSPVTWVTAEGIKCNNCHRSVHMKCLKKGSVPGGLSGDVFFCFTCQECSVTGSEDYVRDKMPWLQAIVLVLYHMQNRTPGLARKGFFHWKTHIATFIDKHWDLLFRRDFKRKKKWMGTISGTLSHYSPLIFSSGTYVFNDQGWWTLTYPKLTPKITVQINSEFLIKKQKNKDTKLLIADADLFALILQQSPHIPEEYTSKISVTDFSGNTEQHTKTEKIEDSAKLIKSEKCMKRTNLLPSIDKLNEGSSKKLFKSNRYSSVRDDLTASLLANANIDVAEKSLNKTDETGGNSKPPKFLDAFCHYNTSLNNIATMQNVQLSVKLMGGITTERILSPYSGLYLKPYIRRDTSAKPQWLQLMAEILAKTNQRKPNWTLPPRGPLDYTYVQPSHIPAINSLCNQFFWPGIDLTDCLQYPDFSCVVLYRKLVIGFAFVVPDVKFNENYLSFIFVRPGWTNVGIGKFMLYHLIQTSCGKDLTLHVSINNSALFLYQKFGFKVENVVLDFYYKYLRRDTKDSKHAFFCRLER